MYQHDSRFTALVQKELKSPAPLDINIALSYEQSSGRNGCISASIGTQTIFGETMDLVSCSIISFDGVTTAFIYWDRLDDHCRKLDSSKLERSMPYTDDIDAMYQAAERNIIDRWVELLESADLA